MKPLGIVRRWLLLALLFIGGISFFLPIVSINAPIVGRIQWSALNVVSSFSSAKKDSPSFSDISKAVTQDKPARTDDQGSVPSHHDIPFGIAIAPYIPLEIALSYLLLICAGIAIIMPPLHRALNGIGILGFISSGTALLSVFLFSNAIQQSMAARMNDPEMRDNPFAALGQALVQSFRVDPGIALYLLVFVMVTLLAVVRFGFLDKATIAHEISSAAAAGR